MSNESRTQWTIKDLVFAYATLRGIHDPTDREKEMIAGIEPHLHRLCINLTEHPSLLMEKLLASIKAFTDGDMEKTKALMDEMAVMAAVLTPRE